MGQYGATYCDNCGKRHLELHEVPEGCCSGSCLRPIDQVALRATRVIQHLGKITASRALCDLAGEATVKGEDLFRIMDYLGVAEKALEVAAAVLACHEAGVQPPIGRLEGNSKRHLQITSVSWLATGYLSDKLWQCQKALGQ